jgi:hypothetical protein
MESEFLCIISHCLTVHRFILQSNLKRGFLFESLPLTIMSIIHINCLEKLKLLLLLK